MNLKNIILIVGLIGSLYIGYTTFFASDSGEEAADSASSASQRDVSAELVSLLEKVKSIELDGGIFNSESFQSLEDMTSTVQNEPVGRNNPFAPVGTDGAFVGVGPGIQGTTTGVAR